MVGSFLFSSADINILAIRIVHQFLSIFWPCQNFAPGSYQPSNTMKLKVGARQLCLTWMVQLKPLVCRVCFTACTRVPKWWAWGGFLVRWLVRCSTPMMPCMWSTNMNITWQRVKCIESLVPDTLHVLHALQRLVDLSERPQTPLPLTHYVAPNLPHGFAVWYLYTPGVFKEEYRR